MLWCVIGGVGQLGAGGRHERVLRVAPGRGEWGQVTAQTAIQSWKMPKLLCRSASMLRHCASVTAQQRGMRATCGMSATRYSASTPARSALSTSAALPRGPCTSSLQMGMPFDADMVAQHYRMMRQAMEQQQQAQGEAAPVAAQA